VEIDKADDQVGLPRMNECGEMVYSIGVIDLPGTAVFRYDNGLIEQLSDDPSTPHVFPDINSNGTVVWTRGWSGFGGGEIAMFERGVMTILAEGSRATINDMVHIAFYKFEPVTCASESGVFFYDGETVDPIMDDGLSNQWAEINNLDDVVWTRKYSCANPWVADIMFWSDGRIIQLTDSAVQQNVPTVNDLGHVAWQTADSHHANYGIWKWEGDDPQLVIVAGQNPRLNNNGDMQFLRWDEGLSTWDTFVYIDGVEYQLTSETAWNIDGDINDWGEVVWHWALPPIFNGGIRHMRRIRTGEADFDGHIDLRDAAAFQNCMTGPGDFDGTVGGFDRLCDCRFLDIDHDRDVDRDDYALFAAAMTGPQ
ncbi:MAG: hypothetical protein IID36_10025, partial [Planctomycetes bacterium]|nr:hypothetical protein [Planctomycetota bacterium]